MLACCWRHHNIIQPRFSSSNGSITYNAFLREQKKEIEDGMEVLIEQRKQVREVKELLQSEIKVDAIVGVQIDLLVWSGLHRNPTKSVDSTVLF